MAISIPPDAAGKLPPQNEEAETSVLGAILLSEQNAQLSLAIADRCYVIENGRVALSGSGQDLLRSKDVADRYLGVGAKPEHDGSGLMTFDVAPWSAKHVEPG